MTTTEPTTTIDARFSDPSATATPWAEGAHVLESADVYWLTTVRADGRPHVTPLLAVWTDDALHFCTGPAEQKAKNIAAGAHVVLTTGTNNLTDGVDVVVEGEAVRVADEVVLGRLAAAWESKYGPEWHFDVQHGNFLGDGGEALVFRVEPSKVLGFAKSPYAQTRWRF